MIQEQFKKGKNPTGLLALQQIADFMTTNVPNVYPAAPQGGMAALNMSEYFLTVHMLCVFQVAFPRSLLSQIGEHS